MSCVIYVFCYLLFMMSSILSTFNLLDDLSIKQKCKKSIYYPSYKVSYFSWLCYLILTYNFEMPHKIVLITISLRRNIDP